METGLSLFPQAARERLMAAQTRMKTNSSVSLGWQVWYSYASVADRKQKKKQVVYGLHAVPKNIFRRLATIESIGALVSTVATRREIICHLMQAVNDLPKLRPSRWDEEAEQLRGGNGGCLYLSQHCQRNHSIFGVRIVLIDCHHQLSDWN